MENPSVKDVQATICDEFFFKKNLHSNTIP